MIQRHVFVALLAGMIVGLLLEGCASSPAESTRKAGVENRSVRDAKPAAAAKAPDRPAAEARAAEETGDARLVELRRTVERQARRIAELEARPAEGEVRQVVDLLAFSQRFATLAAEEQAREYELTRQEQAREPNLYSRIRLAMMLSLPGTAFQDDARAGALLDAVAAQSARTPLRQLAVLVHAMVNERLREQRRSAQLKEQIDSLRAIERSLIEREPSRSK